MCNSKDNAVVYCEAMNFNGKTLNPIMINGEPHFVAVEVCDILGLENPSERLKNSLDNDEYLPYVLHRVGQKRTVNVVNESGLYNLIFQSRKPEAKAFKKWVTKEVLPAIRKTGRYEIRKSDNAVVLIADGIELHVLPSERHVFLVPTREIARALNVSHQTISTNKSRYQHIFKEDVHYISKFDWHNRETNLTVRCTVWTRKGLIEHAQYLRGGYSKELRDWADREQMGIKGLPEHGDSKKRRHNRLTPERLLDIMSYVSQIENHDLRKNITERLIGQEA